MTDKEKAIRWFENIAEECDKLTSGNVAHLRAQIKGMAIRSAKYLKKHSQEPVSEDLEQAAIDYDSRKPALYGEDDEGDYVEYIEVRKDAFIAGARWQREQMMKDAIECEVHQTEVEGIELDSVEICSDGLMLDKRNTRQAIRLR